MFCKIESISRPVQFYIINKSFIYLFIFKSQIQKSLEFFQVLHFSEKSEKVELFLNFTP